jgi:hypothetical protein
MSRRIVIERFERFGKRPLVRPTTRLSVVALASADPDLGTTNTDGIDGIVAPRCRATATVLFARRGLFLFARNIAAPV